MVSFSGKYFDADPFVTKDGNSIYFSSNRPVNAGDTVRPDTDIWKVERTVSGSWGKPVHLDSPLNSNRDEHYPTIADNGNMYFGSGRAGGKGGSDIYYAKFSDGSYSAPEILTDAVNTVNNEYEPFIAKDESYLIFMATVPDGLVNADFYISYKEQGSWTKAVKLDAVINSPATEWAPKVSANGRYFYFGSTRAGNRLGKKPGGLSDIYQVDIKALNLQKSKPFSKDSLQARVEELVRSTAAKIGVSMLHIETAGRLACNGDMPLPMLSVYKFPVAMYVLSQVDKGRFNMQQQITIAKELIHPGDAEVFGTQNFPQGKATLQDLLSLMLVYGSNTACDILLKEIQGPAGVQQYMRKLGIKNISIASTEREIQSDAAVKYKNQCTANEMVKLLAIARDKNKLSTGSHAFLWEKMASSVTGPNRIKGLLPKHIQVAHRTGTANNAYNDVGIISLPNGHHLAIAVFITDATAAAPNCDLIIAKIAKLAFDHYSLL